MTAEEAYALGYQTANYTHDRWMIERQKVLQGKYLLHVPEYKDFQRGARDRYTDEMLREGWIFTNAPYVGYKYERIEKLQYLL